MIQSIKLKLKQQKIKTIKRGKIKCVSLIRFRLEIVRDRLQGFQSGEFACRENAIALTHLEECLLWMNKRVEDRAERGVLGTSNK
jgi:hypothetical protein